jgi:anthranilate phosphoribosyltransferase
MQEFLRKILTGEQLTTAEAAAAMDMVMEGSATQAQVAGLLVGLRLKGERAHEVVGFVESMRRHMICVEIQNSNAVDGCGTGGDGSHSFNISTAAAIVASAAGAVVAKHGNRSVSSKCGSADLLEAVGADIDPGPEIVERTLKQLGFGFLFAPRFHPAMKHAAPVRKELGIRTVFNILGPLCNPAGVKRQLVGVYDKRLLWLVAEVLAMTGSEHVIVVHSEDGLDELSVSAPTDCVEWRDGNYTESRLLPTDLIGREHPLGILAGGEPSENVEIFKRLLSGEQGPYTDASALNAGAMLHVAGVSSSILDGVNMARTAINNGSASSKLAQWIAASKGEVQ